MPSYEITGDGLFYTCAGESEYIISFWEFYSNLGSRPLHSIDENARTVPAILTKLNNLYGILTEGEAPEAGRLGCIIACAALLKQSFLGYRPLNILVSGRGQGVLGGMLACAAGETHQDSRVYVLLKDMRGGAFIDVLDRIGPCKDNLKYLSAELGGTLLRDAFFDMAVFDSEGLLNENQEEALKNLTRVTRNGGFLVCSAGGGSVLAGLINAMPGNNPVIYKIADERYIFIKQISEENRDAKPDPAREFKAFRDMVSPVLADAGNAGHERLRAAVSLLRGMERIALSLFNIDDIDLKTRVIEAKEQALNILYSADSGFRKENAEKLSKAHNEFVNYP